jgi:hypothetical protein
MAVIAGRYRQLKEGQEPSTVMVPAAEKDWYPVT